MAHNTISDRRELDETRAYLAAIVEHTSDAVIGKKLDGTIVSWNAAAERMYGYTADEAIGQHMIVLGQQGRYRVPSLKILRHAVQKYHGRIRGVTQFGVADIQILLLQPQCLGCQKSIL